MTYDFDIPVPLKNTHSAKYDAAGAAVGATADDTIPMWVADMDFRVAQPILDALQAEVDRGVIGYYADDMPLRTAICDWFDKRHAWKPDPSWIYFTHGVVAAFGTILEAFSDPGDGVILFTPVYHAFARKIEAKHRHVVESLLEMEDGQYVMNLDALEAQLTGSEKILVFCTPHNPGGRLWTEPETKALVDFCQKHDLKLVSDEIHMDLTFDGARHLNTAAAAPSASNLLITLGSASKAFNIAGGETGFMIAADRELRAELARAHASHGGTPNRFGMLMMEAAFTRCDDWLAEVCAYIAGNVRLFEDGVNAIPGLSVMNMQSTYLAWVDFSGTGLTRDEFTKRVITDARIAVNFGPTFGSGGESYLRFNLATRRELVAEAVERLGAVFS